MHLGLVMECDYRERVLEEALMRFYLMDMAENLLDGIWLAERHLLPVAAA
jgi:hypothetical protein